MNKSPSKKGILYTIAAPSGTGKTTLVKALTESLPNLTVSISHTTRPQRPAEQHGVNYYFIQESEFRQLIDHGDFLEYATVFNNFYGTSRRWVEDTLNSGKDVILEIDWQGCQQIKQLFPDCVSIFILPPSLAALSERLLSRNQDNPEIIKKRLADAREAVSHVREFEYAVVNDHFDSAIHELKVIIQAAHLLQMHQRDKFSKLLDELSVHS